MQAKNSKNITSHEVQTLNKRQKLGKREQIEIVEFKNLDAERKRNTQGQAHPCVGDIKNNQG